MKIENEKFYLLTLGDSKEIYPTEADAIAELKATLQGHDDVDESKVSLVEANVSGDWKITQVPWSRIAMELLRGA